MSKPPEHPPAAPNPFVPPEHPPAPPKAPFIALTLGGVWSQLFEDCLSRQMAGIAHIRLGNPQYRLPEDLFRFHIVEKGLKQTAAKELFDRLNGKSIQASEIVFRIQWFAENASILFVDSKVLDTAIGQFLISEAKRAGRPAYGVSTDSGSSPIAAAFLKATLYPDMPDDLVKICLQHRTEGRKK